MRLRLTLVVVVAAAFAGCRAAPPACCIEGDYGTVRAATDANADDAARLVARLIPRVRGLLPDTRERSVDVWLQPQIELYRGSPYPQHIAGMADDAKSRIHLRSGDPDLELHLAHELVHLMLGDSWKALPGVMEEGLCDLVASRVVGGASGQRHHARRMLEAAGYFGGFEALLEMRRPGADPMPRRTEVYHLRLAFDEVVDLGVEHALAMDDAEVFERSTQESGIGLYGLGYLLTWAIVEARGFEGLRELCADAKHDGEERVPARRLLAAAGAGKGAEGCRRLIDEALGPECLPQLADLLADSLASTALDIARDDHPVKDASGFLAFCSPRLGLLGSDVRFALQQSDAFAGALRTHW